MFKCCGARVCPVFKCSSVREFDRVHEFDSSRVREFESTSVRELGSLGFSVAFGSSRKGGREKHLDLMTTSAKTCAVEWVTCAREDVIPAQS